MEKTLTPAMFEILVALADGERHGYSIMQEIEARGTRHRIGPGTLYRSIQKLIELGFIEESQTGRDRSVEDERRRYYRITDAGRKTAAVEAARLAELVALARSRRLLPRPRTT